MTAPGPDPVYDRFRPDDLAAFAYLLRQGFGIPHEDVERYRALLGEDAYRVLRRDGRPVGAAAVWSMGQWFGGRPVPARAVAVVTADPTARGSGLGTALMRGVLHEAAAEGCALSVLYGATVPPYAKLGYARAGSAIRYRAASAALDAGPPPGGLRHLDPLDADRLAALRRAGGLADNGMVERSEALWTMLLRPGDAPPCDAFLVDGENGPEGYVVVRQPTDGRLTVVDVCLRGPSAARRVLGFLAGYRAQADSVVWPGGPEDPLAHLAADSGAEIEEWEDWLVRIVDVERALALRGYPAGITAALTLAVDDPLLAANRGRFRLCVANGRAAVERVAGSGPADVVLPVAALAPLYTGHIGPAALARMGLLAANDAGIAAAAQVFGGPRPWMADRF